MHTNILPALSDLRRYYQDYHGVNDERADYFRSEAYQLKLEMISKNPAALAQLAIAYLSHVALDPRHHSDVENTLMDYPGIPMLLVHLQFYRITSPIPVFTLATNSPEADLLRAAIRKNLESRKYKASQAHARQHDLMAARYRRVDRKASAARAIVWGEATPALSAVRRSERDYSQMYDEVRARATAAYNAVYQPIRNCAEGRLHALLNACYDKEYQGSYYASMVAFANAYLYEAVEQEPALA